MIKPRLRWSERAGEGSVTFSREFDAQHWVLKADALLDWIVDLTEKYDSLMGCDSLKDDCCDPDKSQPAETIS